MPPEAVEAVDALVSGSPPGRGDSLAADTATRRPPSREERARRRMEAEQEQKAFETAKAEIDAVLRKRKIRIPVVGCDGVVPREPPDDYSTVQAPRRECGRLAAELLLKAVRNPGGKIGRHPLAAVFQPKS